jgi:uncharacterized protein (UPF0335 family)
MTAKPRVWPQPDGQPVSCRDKVEILDENYEELRHVMQDAFEDALLMGVDEAAMRGAIAALLAGLKAPQP